MWKIVKMLLGIALLPFCWAVSVAVYKLYATSVDTAATSGWEAGALPLGFLIWVLVYFLLPRPTRAYVLGHELTHALWALMMGGRVERMKIGKGGGHVVLSRTNFIITLAPYFFPFYTFLVIATYYLAGLSVDSQFQPDVREHGRIFSYTVIYVMNVLVIGLWMVLVGAPRFSSFGDLLGFESASAYRFATAQIVSAWIYLAKLIESKT
jgi:hypothetical protein